MHNIDPELDASIHQHLAEEDKAEKRAQANSKLFYEVEDDSLENRIVQYIRDYDHYEYMEPMAISDSQSEALQEVAEMLCSANTVELLLQTIQYNLEHCKRYAVKGLEQLARELRSRYTAATQPQKATPTYSTSGRR